ncbi:hunchback isoform X1 [Temnothorax americanus]|uniref:hunchback isoform X1 n=1 Tax=Temnothorax americanus TaxID=1964332 RepID=UPI00406806F7
MENIECIITKMDKCKKEYLDALLGQQQHQQQHQQQTTVKEQFLSPTTPAWGDRNVKNEQSLEETKETNNNGGFSTQSDLRISMSSSSQSSKNSSSSSTRSSTENTTNNQSSQLPRRCKLCPYIANERMENIEHIITHCTFAKDTYVEKDYSNGYDEEQDDSGNETQSKGKKRPRLPRPKPCSKCDFIADTKPILWLHLRQHFIREDCPGFICPLCPFATTLKHHMTFHWFSAHDDFKGFVCTECQYTCVSKSMLTSHMKTHSEVYQYNCGDCVYKTKFCNAMKKHLKDNRHTLGMVLNPDGTRNPSATIDVYGTKRGPRRRPIVGEEKEFAETAEDRPSTSEIISPISMIPILPALISSSPISTVNPRSTSSPNSPSSKVTLTSPVKVSPVRTSPTQVPSSHSNSRVKNIMTMLNGMTNENGVNPSSNPNINQNTNKENPLLNPMFSTLCQWWVNEIATRRDSDDKETGQVFRLMLNAQKFLPRPKYTENLGGATGANGGVSDNASTFNEPSTSTAINRPSTSMAIDEPSTSTMLVSEHQPSVEEMGVSDEPLDLSMSAMSKLENQLLFEESIASIASTSRRNKRKRKATRLAYPTTNENTNDNGTRTPNTDQIYTEPSLPALLTASQSDLQRSETLNVTHNANIYNSSFICYYCHIIFANEIMYAMHMGFHSAENPLVCAVCDRKSSNIIAFFLHLIRTKH